MQAERERSVAILILDLLLLGDLGGALEEFHGAALVARDSRSGMARE